MYRTKTCGELRSDNSNEIVTLCGWVHSIRTNGFISFIDLRDRYGITQITLDEKFKDVITNLRKESIVQIVGKVRLKPEPNKKIETGDIEVICESLKIINKSEVLPISLDEDIETNEDMRLKYRYLDLRKNTMKENIIFRHKVVHSIRNYLNNNGFLEIETPYLIKSTPEGARDFLVPSRVNKGKMYSLPQSPQLYKQLLMVSGFDRYYQIARCFRDEDLRADRQPEFTQLDLEMSFAHQEDVIKIGEGIMKTAFKDVLNIDLPIPFEKITYKEAMDKYGCDKPDLRFGMELIDLTEDLKSCEFKVFNSAKKIKCLVAPKIYSRKGIDKLTKLVKIYKAKGLAYLKYENGTFDGPILKFLSETDIAKIKDKVKDQLIEESTIFFVADNEKIVNDSLAALRNHMGLTLELYDKNKFKFCWVVDFPLFEWNEDEQDFEAAHHMFTMPKKECLDMLENDKGNVIANCYDLVLNGIEIASGSERIHDPEIQKRVMKAMNISEEDANEKFGFLIEAFRYGAPPHAGFAPGLDRLVALMRGFNDIREVIAFPKNKQMENPMDGCPSVPTKLQLEESNIEFVKVEKGDKTE